MMKRPASALLVALTLGLAWGGGLGGSALAQAEAETSPATTDPFDDPFFSSQDGQNDPFDGEEWDELENWAEETQGAGVTNGAEATENTATSAPSDAAPPQESSQFSSLELVRQGDDGKERRIRVVRRGSGDETGIFAICQPPEGFPDDAPTLAVFSESGAEGVEITIGDNVIQVPLAVVTQSGGEEATGDGRIEAGGGTARYLEAVPEGSQDRLDLCAVAVEQREAAGSVQVRQGQTELVGQSLKYDESDGVAYIAGPIQFDRSGNNPIAGTSNSIEVNVDNESTVLVGTVELRSEGGRVSRAARVEYDDQQNLARLLGTPEQPASSERDGEKLQALEILYDLERDEAVAWASEGVRITGTFTDDAP